MAGSYLPRVGALFDSPLSCFIFCSYILLFVNQGLLARASQTADHSYNYNTVAAVLLTELVKLVASLAIFVSRHDWRVTSVFSAYWKHKSVLALYLVPSSLYYVYNVLSYVNLSRLDPTSYFLLLQMRVVVTGLLFQWVFERRLSGGQWCSMLLLTLGCVVKQLQPHTAAAAAEVHVQPPDSYLHLLSAIFTHMPLIMVQVFCSCFAGVYNEYLLKQRAADADIWLQNSFMYVDSLVCGVFVWAASSGGQVPSVSLWSWHSSLFSPLVLLLIANNAAVGLVTSVFLQRLNSIVKTFASSIELLLTALLCWLLFDVPVGWHTAVAIALVSLALHLYCRQPVVNPPQPPPPLPQHVSTRSPS